MNKRLQRLRNYQSDDFWAMIFARPMTILFLYPVIEKPWLTPNRVTTASLITKAIALYFIAFVHSYTGAVWGAVLINLGLVFDNIPNVMIHNNETQGVRSIENSPSSFRMGATYEVTYATMLIAEGTFPLYDDQLFRFAGGVEQKLGGVFILRLGAEKETLQSYDSPWHLTSGFGFVIPRKDKNIYLDGAFDFNTDRSLLGIWDISVKVDL
jgi:hypothetical protein